MQDVRGMVFRAMAGSPVTAVITALNSRGILDALVKGPITKMQAKETFGGNSGYLAAAFQILLSLGWLTVSSGGAYALTAAGKQAITLGTQFGDVNRFIPSSLLVDEMIRGKSPDSPLLGSLIKSSVGSWAMPNTITTPVSSLIDNHLDGVLLGPITVGLHRTGLLETLEKSSGPLRISQLPGDDAVLIPIFRLLDKNGWVRLTETKVEVTDQGRYALKIAPSWWVTVSYSPMFAKLYGRIFEPVRSAKANGAGVEWDVDRDLNLEGCFRAHKIYFEFMLAGLLSKFSGPPSAWPRFHWDTGGGDGDLSVELYHAMRNQLGADFPTDFAFVNADFNPIARDKCARRFADEGIPNAHVIFGDVGDPDVIAAKIGKLGLDPYTALCTLTFLGHNRPDGAPEGYATDFLGISGDSVFVHDNGMEIPEEVVHAEHLKYLRRWAAYWRAHGLCETELHIDSPLVLGADLSRTPSIAYLGTHAFSNQLCRPYARHMAAYREAGLVSSDRFYNGPRGPNPMSSVHEWQPAA